MTMIWCQVHASFFFFFYVFHLGWKNPNSMDVAGSHCVQKVYFSKRRLELRDCHVGGDVVRGAAILGDVQSGCKFSSTKFVGTID